MFCQKEQQSFALKPKSEGVGKSVKLFNKRATKPCNVQS